MYIRRANRTSLNTATVVLLTLGFASAGAGQSTSTGEITPEANKTPDEIIVYGQTNVIILRNALFIAQENFFDLFNSLNSNDEFDVECKKRQKSITERRKEHRCVPSFALKYAAQATGGFIRSAMGNGFTGMASPGFANLDYQARVRIKEKQMWAEIVELVKTNPEFREEIRELQRANRALDAERERRLAAK